MTIVHPTKLVPHNCIYCGGPRIRHDHDPIDLFNKRNFCSRQCWAKSRVKTYAIKHCNVCDGEIIKRERESIPEYTARKLCSSVECHAAWKSRVRHTESKCSLAAALSGWAI